jgi:hypothetical protein
MSGGFGILSSGTAPQGNGILGGGFLDGLHNAVADNSGMLMGVGMGLMSGDMQAASQGALQGMRQDQQARLTRQAQAEAEQKRVAAMQWAEKNGLSKEFAAGDPDGVLTLARSLELKKRTPREPTEWERLTQGLSPEEVQKARRYKLGLETKPATTDDIQEYEYAKGQGFQGTFPQFLQSKRGGASNAPSGYTYGPDGKLAPIPGGPQDPDRDINEPLPGEVASRFGLANEYFKRFDGIEKDLTSKDPRAVGPIDSLGFGQSGAIQRDMKLGSEAMIRMLTGAGMNKEEAENEVKQYLPGPGDNAKTVLDKQYRLRSALRSMQREALQGRRSRRQIDADYPELESPDYGEVSRRADEGSRGPVGHNRATGGAERAVKGRVFTHPSGATIERLD